MQYQLSITAPSAKGARAEVVVDSKMDFLSLHHYLERLLLKETGSVATFIVLDRAGERVVELTPFEAEGIDSQRPMAGVPLEEYVESGSLCFDYAFGLFLDTSVRVEVEARYQEPLRHDVPACIATRGSFHFENVDPLLRNLDDIDAILRESIREKGDADAE